jgi:chemotaxis protein histidine kinase CheA
MRFAINNKGARRIALAAGLTAVSILECNCLFASEKGLKATDAKYGGDGMAIAGGFVLKGKQSVEPLSKIDTDTLEKINSGKLLGAEVSFSLKFGKFIKIEKDQAIELISSIVGKDASVNSADFKIKKSRAGFGESRYDISITIERKEKKEADSINEELSKMERKTGDSLAGIVGFDIDYLDVRLKELGSVKDSEEIKKLVGRVSELKANHKEAIVQKEERLKAEEVKKAAEKEAIAKQKEQERIVKEAEKKKKEEAKAYEDEKIRYQELKEKSEKAKVKEGEKKIEEAVKKVKIEEKAKKEMEKESEKKQKAAEFEAAQKEADKIKLAEKAEAKEKEAEEKKKFEMEEAQKDKEWKEMAQEEKAKKLEEKTAVAAEKPKLKEMISKVEPIAAPKLVVLAASKPVVQAAPKVTVKPVSEAVKTLQSTNLDYVASMINEAMSTKETSLSEPGSKSEVSKTFESIKKAFGTEGNVIESDKIRILLEKWDEEGKQYAIKFVPKITQK